MAFEGTIYFLWGGLKQIQVCKTRSSQQSMESGCSVGSSFSPLADLDASGVPEGDQRPGAEQTAFGLLLLPQEAVARLLSSLPVGKAAAGRLIFSSIQETDRHGIPKQKAILFGLPAIP